jgi:hypothetical protein
MEFNLVFKRGMEEVLELFEKNCAKTETVQTGTLNKVGIAEFSYKYHIYRGCILPTYIYILDFSVLGFWEKFLALWQIVFSNWQQIGAFLGFRLSSLDLFFWVLFNKIDCA